MNANAYISLRKGSLANSGGSFPWRSWPLRTLQFQGQLGMGKDKWKFSKKSLFFGKDVWKFSKKVSMLFMIFEKRQQGSIISLIQSFHTRGGPCQPLPYPHILGQGLGRVKGPWHSWQAYMTDTMALILPSRASRAKTKESDHTLKLGIMRIALIRNYHLIFINIYLSNI